MIGRGKVKLNSRGIEEILKSADMQRAVHDLAEQVAEHVRSQGITVGDRDGGPYEIPLPVEVDDQVTDRARSVVRIKHPAGLAVQAKHGALTRAAAEAGLQVHSE